MEELLPRLLDLLDPLDVCVKMIVEVLISWGLHLLKDWVCKRVKHMRKEKGRKRSKRHHKRCKKKKEGKKRKKGKRKKGKMTKFRSGFTREAKKAIEQEKEQKRLHDKHGIDDPDTIIVEKVNMTKFLIRCIGRGIRIAATVIVFVLAAIGLMTILYPAIRTEFLTVFSEILYQVRTMTGF